MKSKHFFVQIILQLIILPETTREQIIGRTLVCSFQFSFINITICDTDNDIFVYVLNYLSIEFTLVLISAIRTIIIGFKTNDSRKTCMCRIVLVYPTL